MSKPEKIKITDPTRVLTLANMISLLRAVMAVPIVYALSKNMDWKIVLALVVIAVASDALDGYFARKAQEVTQIGKWLDPLADFIVVITVVFHMVLNGLFPVWFFIFYLFRMMTIALFAVYLMNNTSFVISANRVGKWFIGFTALSVAGFIFPVVGTTIQILLLTIATILGLISWIFYIRELVQVYHNLA